MLLVIYSRYITSSWKSYINIVSAFDFVPTLHDTFPARFTISSTPIRFQLIHAVHVSHLHLICPRFSIAPQPCLSCLYVSCCFFFHLFWQPICICSLVDQIAKCSISGISFPLCLTGNKPSPRMGGGCLTLVLCIVIRRFTAVPGIKRRRKIHRYKLLPISLHEPSRNRIF